MSLHHSFEVARHWVEAHSLEGNVLSIGALVATFAGLLPHIGAGLSIVWFGLKIAIAIEEYRIIRRKKRGEE